MSKFYIIRRLFFVIYIIGVTPRLFFQCFQDAQILDQNRYQIPYLKKLSTTTQIIVEDEPFIILGGELGNSSFTSLEYMTLIWPKLKAMNLNTVLAHKNKG